MRVGSYQAVVRDRPAGTLRSDHGVPVRHGRIIGSGHYVHLERILQDVVARGETLCAKRRPAAVW